MTVDARGLGALPPGVPRLEEVENSPGKEAWLRGMDAVVQHDWQLALACFQTAQQKDPTNAALGRAVDLAKWTWERQKAASAQPQRAKSEPPVPNPVTAAEMARLEAVLDKAFESLDPSIAPVEADRATHEASRAEERNRVERANLTLADQFGREALQRFAADDLSGAIELLREAESLAPQVPNFRATKEWLQTDLAIRRAGKGAVAVISKAAGEAHAQVGTREEELKRAEAAVIQAQRALALAREYHDAAAERVAEGALLKGDEAVRAASDRLGTARATEAHFKALLEEQSADATRQK
jgi:hypothetical protein